MTAPSVLRKTLEWLCLPLLLVALFTAELDAKAEPSTPLLAPLTLDAGDFSWVGLEGPDSSDNPDHKTVTNSRAGFVVVANGTLTLRASFNPLTSHPLAFAPRGPPIS